MADYYTLEDVRKLSANTGKKYYTLTEVASAPNRELPPLTADPTDGMSGLDKFRAGIGKGMTDVARGVGQSLGLVSRDDVAESRKRDAPLMKTGAGLTGGIVGGAAVSAPLAFVPGANTMLGGAGIGMLSGAMQPSTSTSETFANAGMGGAAGAAIPGLIQSFKVGKSLIEPFYQKGRDAIVGRTLNSAAGADAGKALQNLQGAQSGVPGSFPTVGEAAGVPSLAALQRAASATNPNVVNEVSRRMAGNNDARIEVLQNIASSKDASIAAREAATTALYQLANGQRITITPELTSLLSRPVMQSATGEARNLAANEGRQFSMQPGTPPQPSAILGPGGAPASMTPGVPGSMLGRDAHTIKMALDDTIEGLAGMGMAKNAKRAAVGAKEQFLDQIEQQAPAYGQARQAFADLSKPVNQAEIAELMLQRATNNIRGEMTPAAFNRAFSDRTAQSALGRKGATLEGTFSPQQMQSLEAVKKDLLGLDFLNTQGRGVGSDTVQKLAFNNLMQRSGLPPWLGGNFLGGTVGNLTQRFGQLAYKDANDKLAEQLAMTLMNPKQAAGLMQGAAPTKGLLSIENALKRSGLSLTALPGLLSSESE